MDTNIVVTDPVRDQLVRGTGGDDLMTASGQEGLTLRGGRGDDAINPGIPRSTAPEDEIFLHGGRGSDVLEIGGNIRARGGKDGDVFRSHGVQTEDNLAHIELFNTHEDQFVFAHDDGFRVERALIVGGALERAVVVGSFAGGALEQWTEVEFALGPNHRVEVDETLDAVAAATQAVQGLFDQGIFL